MSISVGSSPSFAFQQTNNAVKHIFKQFDADKSGQLNLNEALKSGAPDKETFKLADADGNGGVSREELTNFFNKFDKEIKAGGIQPNELLTAIEHGSSSLIESLKEAVNSRGSEAKKDAKSLIDTLLSETKGKSKETKSGSLIDQRV